jgi:hypothetical protein
VCRKISTDMHARQRVAYKIINKNKKMKTIINLNTFIQWPPSNIIVMKINLVKLCLTSKKRNKKLKYAYHHNTRKYR